MKTSKSALGAVLLALSLLGGCTMPAASATQPTATQPETTAPETAEGYITPQLLLEGLEGSAYILIDARTAEDYQLGHIKGAQSAPISRGDNADDDVNRANLMAALLAASGSETGDGRPIVVMCYKGGGFSERGVALLAEAGLPGDGLYILDGGMQAWTDAGEAFAAWME